MNWESLIQALAIVFILEGVGPLLFPNRWQQLLSDLSRCDVHKIRVLGASFVVTGLIFFYVF